MNKWLFYAGSFSESTTYSVAQNKSESVLLINNGLNDLTG